MIDRTFIGWRRSGRRQPSRTVVEADSEDAALALLLAEPPGDKIVLPAGRDPNRRENVVSPRRDR